MYRKMFGGEASQSIPIFVLDTSSAVGAGLGALVFNTTNLAAKYRRKGDATWTAISLITMTLGTWASGGFVTDGGGVTGGYEFGIPNAVIAAGVEWAEIQIYGAANMLPVLIFIELDAVNYQDAVRFGLTAVPNAAAGANGGLPTGNASGFVGVQTGTGAGQLDFTSGVVKSDLRQILGTALTETAGQIAAAFKKFFDKATPTGTVNSLPDAVAGAASGLALVGSNVGAATSVSGAVNSVTNRVTANTDQFAGQTITAAAGVTLPTAVASPTNITGGTITTVTNLTNAPTAGDLTAAMKTSVQTAADAAVTANALVLEIEAETDTLITNVAAVAASIISFPVATITGSPSITTFTCTGLADTTANAYKDAYALFLTGVNAFSAAFPVLTSAYSGGTTTLTFTGLRAAPSAADTVILVGSLKTL